MVSNVATAQKFWAPNFDMVRCHLAVLMGREKVRISDVAEATGLNRSTITALYYERAQRIELEAIEKLCAYFKCDIADLLEIDRIG